MATAAAYNRLFQQIYTSFITLKMTVATLSLPQNVAIAMGVRMLKNPQVTMEQILQFTDNELIVITPDEAVEADVNTAEVSIA